MAKFYNYCELKNNFDFNVVTDTTYSYRGIVIGAFDASLIYLEKVNQLLLVTSDTNNNFQYFKIDPKLLNKYHYIKLEKFGIDILITTINKFYIEPDTYENPWLYATNDHVQQAIENMIESKNIEINYKNLLQITSTFFEPDPFFIIYKNKLSTIKKVDVDFFDLKVRVNKKYLEIVTTILKRYNIDDYCLEECISDPNNFFINFGEIDILDYENTIDNIGPKDLLDLITIIGPSKLKDCIEITVVEELK
jgi:hypothetical protein